jgi:hypothetical protein
VITFPCRKLPGSRYLICARGPEAGRIPHRRRLKN